MVSPTPAGGWRGSPFLFLVVYGLTDVPQPVHALADRTNGVPNGVDVHSFSRTDHEQYLTESFEEGHAWDSLLARDVELAQSVGAPRPSRR